MEQNELARYTVYQLDMSTLSNFINKNGWDKAAELNDKVAAHLACSIKGSEAWDISFADEYTMVADIKAHNLDHVFAIGNGHGEGTIDRFDGTRMHSVSVGDIIIAPTGRAYMVDSCGFNEVDVAGHMA